MLTDIVFFLIESINLTLHEDAFPIPAEFSSSNDKIAIAKWEHHIRLMFIKANVSRSIKCFMSNCHKARVYEGYWGTILEALAMILIQKLTNTKYVETWCCEARGQVLDHRKDFLFRMKSKLIPNKFFFSFYSTIKQGSRWIYKYFNSPLQNDLHIFCNFQS